MKLRVMLAAAVCCAALSGCMPLESNVENLMQPPTLTELQTQVDAALREAVGNDFTLKYPVSGDYRSGYNFIDLDGDNVEEALAFVNTGDESIRIALLRQSPSGWIVSDLLQGHAYSTEVDFVALQELGGLPRLMVGWGGTGRENKLMTLYRLDGAAGEQTSLNFDSRWDYSQMQMADFDQDGLQELLLLVASDSYESTDPIAQLLGRNADGLVDMLDEIELPRNIVSFYTPVVGDIGDGMFGAAVDCRLSSGKLCTITIVCDDGRLRMPIGDIGDEMDTALFRRTMRTQEVLSCDLGADGKVEIPLERLADGYRDTDTAPVYFVDYCNLQGGALKVVRSAYVNLERSWRLLLPQTWNDYPVSALVSADNRETVFFINLSGNLYDHSNELLRIQINSTLDGQDKTATERGFTLATRGSYIYSAMLPLSPPEGMRLTKNDVEAAFALLS